MNPYQPPYPGMSYPPPAPPPPSMMGMPMMPRPGMIPMPPYPPQPPMMVPLRPLTFPNVNNNIYQPPSQFNKYLNFELTTVFVGKIAPGIEDEFIKKLLEQCGVVVLWKRVADPVTGKLKAFGFCDYDSPDSALRALRILDGFQLSGQPLSLKVDEKTKKNLDQFLEKKKISQKGLNNDLIEQQQKLEDDKIRVIIKQLVEKREKGEDYKSVDIDKSRIEAELKKEREKQAEISLVLSNDQEKANLIYSEIKGWKERQAQRDAERISEQKEEEEKEKKTKIERDRERERELKRKEREEREFREREKEWEEREREKERRREKEKEREKRESLREIRDIEYDDYERKKKTKEYLKRKKRIEREKNDDEYEKIQEEQKKKEQLKKEEQMKKEQIKKEQMKKEEEQKILQQQLQKQQQQQSFLSISPSIPTSPTIFSKASPLDLDNQFKLSGFALGEKKKVVSVVPGFDTTSTNNELEEIYNIKKKRKLQLLDSSLHEEYNKKIKIEKARSIIEKIPTDKKQLFEYPIDWEIIEKNNIIENKMRPWITKKIIEYLGEEEKTFIDFLVSTIANKTPPNEILGKIALVLEEEGEVFILKLWRMLIFEILNVTTK